MDPTNSTLDFLLPLNGSYKVNGTGLILMPSDPATDPAGSSAQELERLEQQLDMTRFIAQRILVPLIVAGGVIGNLMNIIVLTRRWMRSSTNSYLTALAICDILYLVFALTLSFKHYKHFKTLDWYIRYQSPFGAPLVDIFSNTGVWLTLTFTIERYIGVCHPMKGKRWCTPQRARYIIVLVSVCATIITFPEFFQSRVKKITNKTTNETSLKAGMTDFANTPTYQFGYMYMNQALFTILPLLLLLVFNTLLINAVLHAAKRRKAMSNVTVVRNERHERQTREQQKITIMLITVVIVFLVCQLPQAITNLYVSYMMATMDPKTINKLLWTRLLINNNICNILVMINSSVNFVLYSSFSTKFRNTFKRVFCKCLQRKDANHLFSEFVSGQGQTTVGETNKYSITYSTTGRTSISAGTSSGVNKPLLKNGNNSSGALLKRDYSGGNLIQSSANPRKKNGYLEVNQGTGESPDNVVSAL